MGPTPYSLIFARRIPFFERKRCGREIAWGEEKLWRKVMGMGLSMGLKGKRRREKGGVDIFLKREKTIRKKRRKEA